jgi:hypothetical protein
MSIAASRGWDVFADDAQQAFINAMRPADKPLWAAYPQSHPHSGHCMLVQRMIYGLHDAPLGWFKCVKAHLVGEQGLKQSGTDECLFTSDDGNLVVVCHVDDFLATGTPTALDKYRTALRKRFKMTGGRVKTTISAESYIERMMTKLDLKPKTCYQTPMEVDVDLPKLTGECTNKALQRRYRQLVGSLMHPSATCHPDISASV